MKLTITLTIKTLIKVALVAVPLIFIILFTAIEYTSQPHFCVSCHNMQPYYDSWKTSSHNEVSCLECHFPPGIEAFIESKTQAISQVAKYFTNTYGTKPWAEISDKSCLRSGCHTERLLHGKVLFKGVIFDHQAHLSQLRRGKQLRCVSCHSQIVQGSHITVTETSCFLCHFKDLPESEPISGCPSCHAEPLGTIEIQGVKFDHQEMMGQGVACRRCHIDVIEGDGAVPRERCMGCHIEPDRLARYDDSEFMHQNHVTDHKVECIQCHLEILHKIKTIAEPLAINCQTCHPDHHAAQRELYMGIGGREVNPIPSPMFVARVSCEGCHIGHKGNEIEGMTRVAEPAACMSCHGTSYAHMQDQWTQGMGRLINQLTPFVQLVAAELEKAESSRNTSITKAEKLHQQAVHNIELVRYGKGAHNVEYADGLIESAQRSLDEALKLLGSPHRIPALEKPASPAGGACLSCHFGIETHVNTVGDRTFQHARHTTAAQLDCSVCHSSQPKGQPGHGETTVTTTADCDGCHHEQMLEPSGSEATDSTERIECQTCHTSDNLPGQLVYQQKPFDHERHIAQRSLACANCHANNINQNFKAECISCHHDEKQVQVEEKCSTCHPDQAAMFEGTKYNTPSLKIDSGVACEDCHLAETDEIGIITEKSCIFCHEDGDYGAVMRSWQTRTQNALNELKPMEEKVLSLLGTRDPDEDLGIQSDMQKARQAYEAAQKEIDFVRADASSGVHNPELTDKLLRDARVRLQRCLDLLSQPAEEE